MNGEWSLKELYQGYDDPAFLRDMKKLDELAAVLTDQTANLAAAEKPAETVKAVLLTLEAMTTAMGSLGLYISLRQATNTADPQASSVMDTLSAKQSATAGPMTRFRGYVAGLPDLEAVIAADPLLTEYAFLLRNIREDARYLLDAKSEEVMALFSISGSGAWGSLQQYLTSTVPVEYRGGTTNLSDIRNLAYDPDPAVRRDAFHAELACYDRIKDAVAFSLNSIKLEVLNHCRLRGYDSPLQETLHNARMSRQTLDALIGAMEEYLPRFSRYFRAKAKLLGHPGGLPWYDLFAPLGAADKQFTPAEAKDYLVSRFSGFDGELTDMVRDAFDQEWIDFFPHDGKVGGAFCAGAFPIRQSRVLTNFSGSFSDVVTLAHELGHAFHNLNLYDNRPLNTDYSMPVAETASTFNEVLVMNDAIRHETDPVRRRALLDEQLTGEAQIICDIYSRYRFETSVFENRDSSFLFPDQLCQLMLEAQKAGYGDGLDYAEPHPYMWLCKSHYYSAGNSFYNWPYAFGGMLARGLYAKYEREGAAFVPLYKRFLKATAEMTAEDAAALAGIDLTDRGFWRMSLESVCASIDDFAALCE